MGNERRSRETCTMSVLERPRYQNAESNKYHSIWRNRTLPKTCIFSVFHIVRYQQTKMHANHSLWRNEERIQEKCLSVYDRARVKNNEKKKSKKHSTWENNNITKTVSFQWF